MGKMKEGVINDTTDEDTVPDVDREIGSGVTKALDNRLHALERLAKEHRDLFPADWFTRGEDERFF